MGTIQVSNENDATVRQNEQLKVNR